MCTRSYNMWFSERTRICPESSISVGSVGLGGSLCVTMLKFVKIGRATLIHWLGWVQHLVGPVGFGCEKLTQAHLWDMYNQAGVV